MPAKHFLVPDYVLQFKCACCTECCKRWRINIDKQTVEKYEQLAVDDPELSTLLAEGLKKDKRGGGVVRLKNKVKKQTREVDGQQKEELILVDSAICPFLDQDGLCFIQKKYGVEALSDTCKIFPRNIFLTERGYEMSLTYACKTAAQTLKNKNMVEFYQDPAGFDYPELHGQYGKIGNLLDRKKAGRTNYFKVEELLIDLMQLRQMDIDTRLILTGIVVDKLKDGDILGISKYLQNMDTPLISQLKTVPSQPVFMFKLIKEAVDKRLFLKITEQEMTRLLMMAYNQLQLLNEAVITDEKVQQFLTGYAQYYRPYLDEISHVYENYFVNFIFSKKYYTHKYLDAYFLMLFFYILIRFFTVCVCIVEDRPVDEDMVVGVIQAIERSVGHNSAYYEDVLRLIKAGDYHRLPYVISLINL
ncbi:MAG: flagellin lysine-N-methylase [Bacillota bacterium]|jgi:lysine-N-methylase